MYPCMSNNDSTEKPDEVKNENHNGSGNSPAKQSDPAKQPEGKKALTEEEVDRMFTDIQRKDSVGKNRETNEDIDIEIDFGDD